MSPHVATYPPRAGDDEMHSQSARVLTVPTCGSREPTAAPLDETPKGRCPTIPRCPVPTWTGWHDQKRTDASRLSPAFRSIRDVRECLLMPITKVANGSRLRENSRPTLRTFGSARMMCQKLRSMGRTGLKSAMQDSARRNVMRFHTASVDSSPCQQPKAERSELERYLLPLLRCHPDVVSAWRSAESTGRYFNAAIKGSYDCRAAQSNEALGFK